MLRVHFIVVTLSSSERPERHLFSFLAAPWDIQALLSQLLYTYVVCSPLPNFRKKTIMGWTYFWRIFLISEQSCFLLNYVSVISSCYNHKQICSKVLMLLSFVGPERPSGHCNISCFITNKTEIPRTTVLLQNSCSLGLGNKVCIIHPLLKW